MWVAVGIVAAVLAGVVVKVGVVGALNDIGFDAEYAAFRSIKVGMTESEVRSRLGSPFKQYVGVGEPSTDYWQDGYSHPARTEFHEVLVYKAVEPILYVFIDTAGVVDETFVEGS